MEAVEVVLGFGLSFSFFLCFASLIALLLLLMFMILAYQFTRMPCIS